MSRLLLGRRAAELGLTRQAPSRCRSTSSSTPLVLARRYTDGEQQKRPSFRGQILESVQERMKRERKEREDAYNARRRMETEWRLGTTTALTMTALIAYWFGTGRPRPLDPESTLTLDGAAKTPFKHNVSSLNLQSAWTDMVRIVGRDNVSDLPGDLDSHSISDWSSYRARDSERPFCIVCPGSTEDVSEIMKVCHFRKLPVTAYCGGTSLEGHYTPTRGGICIDFRRMDNIVALHKDDLDVVVQPAVGWELLNDQLAQDGLFFPPDPGPGAQIGGMIGTGCSGTNAYRYGTMREWVLALTVVLADGTVIKTRQRPRKSSAGYDLTKLFIGSEGTLGLVTEATLKLTVKPASMSVAVSSFGTIRQAADCVARVVADGIPVAALEILDEEQMRCINAAGGTSREWHESPTLFFKFSGTARGVAEQVELVQKIAKRNGSTGFEFARSEAEKAELWSARKEAQWSTIAAGRPGIDKVWTGDVAVPLSAMPGLMEETKADLKKSGLFGTIVGHAGDGNFHLILMSSEDQREEAAELMHRMVKRAVELEGTVTGEHGVGIVKRDYLPHELGESTVDAMRRLKRAFDPLYILNTDKVVRMEKPKKGEVEEW